MKNMSHECHNQLLLPGHLLDSFLASLCSVVYINRAENKGRCYLHIALCYCMVIRNDFQERRKL